MKQIFFLIYYCTLFVNVSAQTPSNDANCVSFPFLGQV